MAKKKKANEQGQKINNQPTKNGCGGGKKGRKK